MSTRFAVVEKRVNARNRPAVEEFVRLAGISAERKLKPAEVKRFARLQTQLMRAGAIVPLTKRVATEHARALYSSLPRWKKLWLRAKYYLHVARARVSEFRLRLRLRLRS